MDQNPAIIGAQWGDEGKGKVVDLLCSDFVVVARFQGGHNAGHTVRFGEKHFALRLIPSGILHEDKLCVLGNGMVIDPQALLAEMAELEKNGVVFGDRLKISESAHCIPPVHRALDLAREEAAGAGKIGTTGRGIGPTYESKMGRYGVLLGDLLDEKVLREKVRAVCAEKNALLSFYGKEPIDSISSQAPTRCILISTLPIQELQRLSTSPSMPISKERSFFMNTSFRH